MLFPLLAVILLGVLWGSTLNLIGLRRENAETAAVTSTAKLLDTYEAQVVRSVREIDSTLRLLQLEAEDGPGSISLAELEARGLLPPSLIFTVTVLDPTGAPIDSTAPGERASLPGREGLAAARAADDLVIGRPVEDPETGGWLLHFIRPLRDGDGSFIGSATVAVGSAYFVSGYEEDALGGQGMLAMLASDGTFLGRRTGTTVSAGAEIEDLAVPVADGGVALVRNPWDGVVRYTASRELYGFPVTVLVGVAAEEVLAPAERDIRVYRARAAAASAVLIAVLALLGTMSWRLQRARQREQRVRREHSERMQHLAHHDNLTGLPNRNLFSRILQQATLEATRYERRMAILFIDLDRFKEINDTLGHDAGDELLKEVARRLKRCLRESDTVARLGGDEFIVFLPQVDSPRAAEVVAKKILVELGRPFLLPGQEFSISGSIGISLFPEDGRDEKTLSKNADIAMYRAKGEGKNTFRFYSEAMTTPSL